MTSMTNEPTSYRPNRVSAPGETLAEILESRGISQTELAARTGRSKQHINEIVAGKAPITHDMAIQLKRSLGAPASFRTTARRAIGSILRRRRSTNDSPARSSGLPSSPSRK